MTTCTVIVHPSSGRRCRRAASLLAAVLLLVGPAPVNAAPRRASRAPRKSVQPPCAVAAVRATSTYYFLHEQACFRRAKQALAQGYIRGKRLSKSLLKKKRSKGRRCSILGIIPSGEYFPAREIRCFKDEQHAKSHVFKRPGSSTQTPAPQSTKPPPTPTPVSPRAPTPVPTLPRAPIPTSTRTAVPTSTRTQLSTVTRIPTNTATATRTATVTATATQTSTATMTATPTFTPTVTPTSTPTLAPITYSFDLGTNENTTLNGRCEATLSSNRANFSFSCTHNVPNATVAHFHLLNNTVICENSSPPATFTNSCALTAAQAREVEQGGALIDVHDGPGLGSDQVIAGLVN